MKRLKQLLKALQDETTLLIIAVSMAIIFMGIGMVLLGY